MKTVSIDEIVSVTEEGILLLNGEKILFSQCKTRGSFFVFDYSIGFPPDFDTPGYEFRYPTEDDLLRITYTDRKNDKWKNFVRCVAKYCRRMGYRRFDMS